MDIEKLVAKAIEGDKTALSGLVSSIQDNVYYLALRMLVNPDDALDATQEVLVKVVTNLSTYRFKSQFKTWVYRVAVNHLLSEKKKQVNAPELTFEMYQQDLEADLQEPTAYVSDPHYNVLLNELRISCTLAMLLCLKPTLRMAYILGDIFELEHGEASEVLSISKENFRKRLSRARSSVEAFTAKSCGHVSKQAKCRCEKKLSGAVQRERIDPERLIFSTGAEYSYDVVKKSLAETQAELRTLKLQTAVTHYKCPMKLSSEIEAIVTEGIQSKKMVHRMTQ